jgi:hypothetical protein
LLTWSFAADTDCQVKWLRYHVHKETITCTVNEHFVAEKYEIKFIFWRTQMLYMYCRSANVGERFNLINFEQQIRQIKTSPSCPDCQNRQLHKSSSFSDLHEQKIVCTCSLVNKFLFRFFFKSSRIWILNYTIGLVSS